MSAAAGAWPPEAASPRPRERFAAPKGERFASRRGSARPLPGKRPGGGLNCPCGPTGRTSRPQK